MCLKELLMVNKISICLFCFILTSCGTAYQIKKNQKYTDKIFQKEFKINGNAFELSRDENNYSYVFSNTKKNETIWYRIFKGKVVETKKFFSKDINFKMLNNIKSIDLNCNENEDWNYILYFKIDDSINNIKFLNFKCLDSIKKKDPFFDYLNSIILQGKPIIW